jgi:hypothetical protein
MAQLKQLNRSITPSQLYYVAQVRLVEAHVQATQSVLISRTADSTSMHGVFALINAAVRARLETMRVGGSGDPTGFELSEHSWTPEQEVQQLISADLVALKAMLEDPANSELAVKTQKVEIYLNNARMLAQKLFEDDRRGAIFEKRASILEACYLASLQTRGAGLVFSGTLAVASPGQVAAREQEFNFAQLAGMKLRAEIMKDAFTAEVEKRVSKTDHHLEGTRNKSILPILERLVTEIVHGMLSGKDSAGPNDGLNEKMNVVDRAFTLEFCAQLSSRLMKGMEFAKEVALWIHGHQDATAARAQKEVVMKWTKEIFENIRAGKLFKPEPEYVQYEG